MDTCTLLVLMGVSGCGKSSVGERVAKYLDWCFLDGDSLHPPRNVERMHDGIPLTDADRAPWLAAIGLWMDQRHVAHESAVIACSALKRDYRDRLRANREPVRFVWLRVSRDELERRLGHRHGHFMPTDLLDSQLATLQPPQPDEPAIHVDADGDIDSVVGAVLGALTTSGSGEAT